MRKKFYQQRDLHTMNVTVGAGWLVFVASSKHQFLFVTFVACMVMPVPSSFISENFA